MDYEMFDFDRFKPIRICGYLFLVVGVGWAVILLDRFGEMTDSFLTYSATIACLYHITIGIGITLRKMWGYYIFRSYLYIFILSFPIGTYISFKTFKYLKKYNIKKYFMNESENKWVTRKGTRGDIHK